RRQGSSCSKLGSDVGGAPPALRATSPGKRGRNASPSSVRVWRWTAWGWFAKSTGDRQCRPGYNHKNRRGSRLSKYVFVTGGVVSSLGKGITAASIGATLKSRSLSVTLQK